MRITALAVAALLSSATAAFAAPASVTVTVGPELQKKAVEKYGVRDVDRLAAERRSVHGRSQTDDTGCGPARIRHRYRSRSAIGRRWQWHRHQVPPGSEPVATGRAGSDDQADHEPG